MKMFVLHDEAGDIKSVIRLDQETEVPAHSLVVPAEGETVTEIPAEGVAADLSPLEIHENYRLDVASGTLVRAGSDESDEDAD
jgi:hypothetical protein